ncbi:hypothetical protein YC2023_103215 [Brassica napus]
MFDYLALAFHKKIDSYGKEPKIVLATNINPKIVGGVQVPEASQPEVVATGSDVKVDNTCSVTEAPSTSDGSLAGRTESASEQVALEENAPKKPRLE